MCECGDTWSAPCPRCEVLITEALDSRDIGSLDDLDAAERRYERQVYGP